MRPKRVKDIVARDISDDETIVVAAESGHALVLNPVGSAVLELCDGTRTVDEIADFICENISGAETDDVHRDVAVFVARLIEAGAVEEPDPCGTPPSES